MIEHDGCVGCKYEHEDEASPHCDKCTQNSTDKYTPVSNADRIRGMADEDLARNNVRKRKGYVTWTTSDGREFSSCLFGCTYRPDEETIALAIQHELNWLRQPCGGVEND